MFDELCLFRAEDLINIIVVVWMEQAEHLVATRLVFDLEHGKAVTNSKIKDAVAVLFEPVHLARTASVFVL